MLLHTYTCEYINIMSWIVDIFWELLYCQHTPGIISHSKFPRAFLKTCAVIVLHPKVLTKNHFNIPFGQDPAPNL